MNWKKISYIILFLAIAYIVQYIIIGGSIIYGLYKEENKINNFTELEIKELKEFQKKWNKELPKLKERVEKGEFNNIKAENSKWERYKIPYTKPLPEFPNMEENNKDLFGIDSNNNGVRDDLEILTVKEFWDDRDVVEVVFAGVRSHDFDIYIYINNLINHKTIDEVLRMIGIYSSCYSFMTYDFNKDGIIYKKYYNTAERKKIEKAILRAFGGHISIGNNVTKEFCEKGIEESKNWMYRNK